MDLLRYHLNHKLENNQYMKQYRLKHKNLRKQYLLNNKGKTFQRQYFTGNCDISPRTVSKYLKMLEECNLIVKLPGKGKHKVNIK